jgi:bifunctional non-homologous end joining protein LigD
MDPLRRKIDPPSSLMRNIRGACKTPSPKSVKPALATLAGAPPEGDDWLHEIKYDGYRVLAHVKNGKTSLFTRHGKDWTVKFPLIASELTKLPVREAWIDGEAVYIRKDGRTSFGDLQKALSEGRDGGLKYIVFDIVFLNGFSLAKTPLIERKKVIKSLFAGKKAGRPVLIYGDYIVGNGKEFFGKACGLSLEGIVSKRMDSPYAQRRSRAWVKVKCRKRQEFVIGGYTLAKGYRKGVGALIVGVYERGRLIYAGRVGTGFTEKTMAGLYPKLKKFEKKTSSFHDMPLSEQRGVRWVRPLLVAEAEFGEWTGKGVLRQASFAGLRADKPAHEIHRETAKGEIKEKKHSPIRKKAPLPAIKLTNPDRLFYPDEGITKKELADYYGAVSRSMLPHLSGRLLTLLRCPEIFKDCFFQKHATGRSTENIKRVAAVEDGKRVYYMTVDSVEGLMDLVQLGALEIHTWGSRSDDLDHPDRAAFDIDPGPGVEWVRLVEAANLIRGLLKELGIKSFVKTTGGKGLHVVFPLDSTNTWKEVEAFTRAFAEYVSRRLPDRFTHVASLKRRKGRIFLDYLRNLRGSTIVEVFSTRAREHAPVSFPVGWNGLSRVRPDFFTVRNFKKYLKRDAWKGYFGVRQRITKEMMKRIGS